MSSKAGDLLTPFLQDADCTLYHGDVLEVLHELPSESVDCVVTSPPYWGLRDYGSDGQIGLEETPDLFVAAMAAVFREVRRVLAPHGTCWVNLGDSYIAAQGGRQSGVGEMPAGTLQRTNEPRERADVDTGAWASRDVTAKTTPARGTTDLKPKDLAGIPWMVAFALRADGWWLRSDIVWSKPNPMPESVTDRPTKAHEYVFLLTKAPRYWFDQEAVREPHESTRWGGPTITQPPTTKYAEATADGFNGAAEALSRPGREWNAYPAGGRNVRSVWTIATQPYPEAHFATYPEELVRRCVLAGCPVRVCRTCGKASERLVDVEQVRLSGSTGRANVPGLNEQSQNYANMPHRTRRDVTTLGWSDCGHNQWRPGVVLDPFVGSGTTCLVARNHGRHSVGIDLNADYLELAAKRLQQLSLLTEAPS